MPTPQGTPKDAVPESPTADDATAPPDGDGTPAGGADSTAGFGDRWDSRGRWPMLRRPWAPAAEPCAARRRRY